MSETNHESPHDDPTAAEPDEQPVAEPGAEPAPAGAYRRTRGRRAGVIAGTAAVLAATAAGALVIANGFGNQGAPLTIAAPSASASPSASATPRPTSSATPEAAPSASPSASPTTAPDASAAPSSEAPAPTSDYDTTTPASLTVLVNKRTPLAPQDYAPDDLVAMADLGIPSINEHSLRSPAAQGIVAMFADAAAQGLVLDMSSGYRDFALQTELYDEHVEQLGASGADEVSARPGRSEHQTGLAADISAPGSDPDCILDTCFADTAAGQWLAENSWRYGFILRYPAGLESVTGFTYEPWHFRFIGEEAASAYHAAGAATLEEFLGAPDAPDYG